ncbi:MAG: MBL fold metallo-hydrolase [Candidatus Limnocylindria bacterium]
MDLESIVTAGLGNSTYVVAADGEAVVVDPPRDAWRVEAVAARRGWRITHVLETHVHNDYLSGALELRASAGAEIVAPARGRYDFAHRGAGDGDAIEVGGLRFVARATPGHTPEHLAWEIHGDGATPGRPAAVLTGGSLMVGSAGRTDLLGKDATDELTAAQFRSLRALAALPDDTAVLPTHGPGSFCGAAPTDRGRTSTIAAERAWNPLLAIDDEATFRATVLASYTPYPAYYAAMAPMNRAGPALLGGLPRPPALDPAGLRKAIAGGARLVDARDRDAVARGHIPGALAVELSDSFASYLGWLLPVGTPVALVLPEPIDEARDDAVAQLVRIGFDTVAGVLDGGIDAWEADGGAIERHPTVSGRALARAGGGAPDTHYLDVRDPHEWAETGTAPGAITIPFWDLPGRLDELPRDKPITVMCKAGGRASTAVSLLETAGLDAILVTRGGAPDWHRSG